MSHGHSSNVRQQIPILGECGPKIGRKRPAPHRVGARAAIHGSLEGHSLSRCLGGKSKLVMIPKRYREPLAYVREQFGHVSIKITVDVYGHLVPGANRQVVNRLPASGTSLATAGESNRRC
jgi:hypothetical protein